MFEIPVTLTSYHPLNTQMEGGPRDRKSRPLITLQQHQSDPDTYPYVSVAGDYMIWPDGQRISLPDIDPNAVFRIVDTGGHFCSDPNNPNCNKVFRFAGHEPLDVCTDGLSIGPVISSAIVFDGDNFTNNPNITLPSYLSKSNISTGSKQYAMILAGIATIAWLIG